MPRTLYVSTAIPYVNAPPHLGFALEIVLADALARHARARGEDVHFVTGTDDNGLSNVRAAEAAGVSVRALVDANGAKYRALDELLGLSFDDFVRTSADPRHLAAVHAIWDACVRAGDLERRPYRGLYCVGCEQFYDPGELQNGLCPEHGRAPEVVEEENWFFRLSRYERPIREALASGRLRIEPPERAREVTQFLAGGLRDVSVSRSRARARGWGIPVPGDPDQVVWVWLDALSNYLATLGYPSDAALLGRFWGGAERRVHVVGKGIARFHAILWPALLLAAGLPLPTTIGVHGYVTVGGQKIGKSRGNAVDPAALVERFGVDAIRYVLLRHVGPRQDADIDEARLEAVYRSELADQLGNLLARTLALLQRHAGGRLPPPPEGGIDEAGERLATLAQNLGSEVDEAMARLAPDDALRAIWRVVHAANKHLADTAPWALAHDPASRPRLLAILHQATRALGAIGRELGPFLPRTAAAVLDALRSPADPSPILFPKEARAGGVRV